MYVGAFMPGIPFAALYAVFVIGVAMFRPAWVPALPIEARRLREPSGSSGTPSVGVLFTLAAVFAILFDKFYYVPKYPEAMLDERLVLAAGAGAGFALAAALVNRAFKLGLLSRLAEQVIFVLIPPLGLIFLVLGTIFLGWATPTEGGAMGASGALLMAILRPRLSFKLMRHAMDTTAQLSSFVVLIGVNMQTSFMHPPFGFALFYLRSVAPTGDYIDKVTSKRMAPVTTGQIYWGAIPFVLIQVVMVGLLIVFPQMSMVYKSGVPDVDTSKVKIEIPGEESSEKPDDILKELQKGAPEGKPKTDEEKAAEELEKALKGGK